jgi:3-hydroxyisobutyrate dehydrogenase-like beta-hydroxyacid dehydrogenase
MSSACELLLHCFPWLALTHRRTGHSIIDLSGEEPGTASLLKLMGNVLIMSTMETVAEVNVFAEKCGLGTNNMQKLMSAMFPNPPHAIYNRRMLSGDYYQAEVM